MKENLVDIEPYKIKQAQLRGENLVRPLVSSDDPILEEELETFDFLKPPVDPIEFAHVLTQSMLYHGGIGLSANQIGERHRAFVMLTNPITCCYNPSIIDAASHEDLMEEGCLSFPNLLIKVKRRRAIKVQYTEPNGNVVQKTFTNMTARIYQHEQDHVNGILFMDRATKFHIDQGKKKRSRILKGKLDNGNDAWTGASYPISDERD